MTCTPSWLINENCGAVEYKIVSDDVLLLTASGKIKAPITPPPLDNHGFYTVSLAKFTKWMAGQVEASGVDMFAGFPGVELLYEDNKVIGVRTGDKGRLESLPHKDSLCLRKAEYLQAIREGEAKKKQRDQRKSLIPQLNAVLTS